MNTPYAASSSRVGGPARLISALLGLGILGLALAGCGTSVAAKPAPNPFLSAKMPDPVYTPAGQGQKYVFTSELIRFLSIGQAFTIFEDDAPPHYPGPPPHIHLRQDEGFYILQGHVTFRGGSNLRKTIVTNPGDYVLIPEGTLHTWGNFTNAPARFLTIFSPPGDFERVVFAAGHKTTSNRPPPPGVPSPATQQAIGRAGRQNFIIFEPQAGQKKH